MPIPLGGDFRLAIDKPIDTRMSVNTFNDLNTIINRYQGLICYVINEQNLYVFQGNNIWEKIVTNNVDSPTIISAVSNFTILPEFNGQVIGVENSSLVTARLLDPVTSYPNGFNVSFIQLELGNIKFEVPQTNINPPILLNRLELNTTAGKSAVASILRFGSTNKFFLYGDLI